MIINTERKQKAAKDRRAINEMFRHLDQNKFVDLLESLSKHDKKEAQKYLAGYITPIMDNAARIEEAKAKIFS